MTPVKVKRIVDWPPVSQKKLLGLFLAATVRTIDITPCGKRRYRSLYAWRSSNPCNLSSLHLEASACLYTIQGTPDFEVRETRRPKVETSARTGSIDTGAEHKTPAVWRETAKATVGQRNEGRCTGRCHHQYGLIAAMHM